MSWTAHLSDDRGHCDGEWGYTHNCNRMIDDCIDPLKLDTTRTPFWGGHAWWDLLDGMAGPAGAKFLNGIITDLRADPDGFRNMNPDNGWGDYDRLFKTLEAMRDAVPEWPTTWTVSG